MMYDLSMVVFFVYERISLIAETEKTSTCFFFFLFFFKASTCLSYASIMNLTMFLCFFDLKGSYIKENRYSCRKEQYAVITDIMQDNNMIQCLASKWWEDWSAYLQTLISNEQFRNSGEMEKLVSCRSSVGVRIARSMKGRGGDTYLPAL